MPDSCDPMNQPTRLHCPWDSSGKKTGVGCHSLLQGIFLTQVEPWSPTLTADALSTEQCSKSWPILKLFLLNCFFQLSKKNFGNICCSLSDLLPSVQKALGSSTALQLTQICSFLWLSNILLYLCTRSLFIHHVQNRTSGKLLCSTGTPARVSVMTQRGGMGVGREVQEGTHV